MNCIYASMPSKLVPSLFGGNLNSYKEALYTIFKRDFIDNDVFYHGKKVDIIHEKLFEDKERSFWHIISEGKEDIHRTPITWRAEVLPWTRPLIQEDGTCPEYKEWKKYHDKTKRDRYYIWCSAINFLVILEDRDTHFKLISAYPVHECKVKYYNKEYEKHK